MFVQEKSASAARAETEQLRQLNIEQQRALRLKTRDEEQLQVNEKVLKEEVARLRAALDREKVHIDAILVSGSERVGHRRRRVARPTAQPGHGPAQPLLAAFKRSILFGRRSGTPRSWRRRRENTRPKWSTPRVTQPRW